MILSAHFSGPSSPESRFWQVLCQGVQAAAGAFRGLEAAGGFRTLGFALLMLVLATSQGWAAGQAGSTVQPLVPVAKKRCRIKDLVDVQGARDNQLIGYGIVVGLNGKGDSMPQTTQAAANLLSALGNTVSVDQLKGKNIASVVVTADIKPFTKKDTRMDITVSALGDSLSLQNGTLLQTPLVGADGEVYAVAQGRVSTGGFYAGEGGQGGSTVQKNHPTVGVVIDGAIVEREIEMDIVQREGDLRLLLRNKDFTSAVRIAQAINESFPATALALDSACVSVQVPPRFRGQEVNFVAQLGQLEAQPDVPARIVISLGTGTIVATGAYISPAVVSYGPLTVTVASSPNVSQPNALSQGATTTTYTTQTDVAEIKGGFTLLPPTASIQDFAQLMNSIGITTLEFVPILEALNAAGALHGELIYK